MTLRGDQYEPAYLKLNPNGVVPTLIHDGEPITESSLILYYIDDALPGAPLMPKQPRQRYRVRMYNKLIDEYVHNSCTILTFATAFRPAFLKMKSEAWQAEISKTGDIQNLHLISGHPMLAPAAIEAVKQWKYKPYLLNGEPVEVETTVQVNFTLSGG